MMFKKGSFEVSSTVYPIAMKYDHRLGDPFWNSSRQGYLAYLVGMVSAFDTVLLYIRYNTYSDDRVGSHLRRVVLAGHAQKGGGDSKIKQSKNSIRKFNCMPVW